MSSASSRSFAKSPTRGEEVANSLSHGLGLLLAIAGLPILTAHAERAGDASAVVGAAIFGVSAILLYLASTLYHAMGIDVNTTTIKDPYGRPQYLVPDGLQPMPELV